MPDMRQPGRSPQRGSQRRGRPAPAAKPTPAWVKVGLIIAPLVLIALVLNLFKGSTEVEKPVAAVVDPNLRINKLTEQVGKFSSDLKKVANSTDPATKKKLGEELAARIESWSEEWDNIFESKRDKKGRLPSELQVYSKTRASVNEMRLDLLKISDF